MTDPRSPLAASQNERAAEEAQREERHQRLATLIGAFADGELPAETASQIDAHLLGCQRCRHELQMHRSLRSRMESEPIPAASTALRDRILSSIAAAPAPQWESVASAAAATVEPEAAKRVAVGRPPIIASVVALMLVAGLAIGGWFFVQRGAQTSTRDTVVAASSVPLVSAALDDYRRVMRGDLPGRGRDLAAIREAVSFPVQPIESQGLRLLAAWTTSLNGEPAAVLAYRSKEHVVLQYIVSDLELYRPAELRRAFADGRLLASSDGQQAIVAWPDSSAGSLLIGDVPLRELESLRRNSVR